MRRIIAIAGGSVLSVVAAAVLAVRLPVALDHDARAQRLGAVTADLRDAEARGGVIIGRGDDLQASLDAMKTRVARLRTDVRAQRKQISKLQGRIAGLGG